MDITTPSAGQMLARKAQSEIARGWAGRGDLGEPARPDHYASPTPDPPNGDSPLCAESEGLSSPRLPRALRGRFRQRERDSSGSIFSALPSEAASGIAQRSGNRNGFGLDDNVYRPCCRTASSSFGSEVKDENANAICAQMLLLNAEDAHKDIYLYINSPGGSVDSAWRSTTP